MIKEQVTDILNEIRTTEYATIQSVHLLLEYAFRLTQYMAMTGEYMSQAKEAHLKKRLAATEKAMQYFQANTPVSIINNYIADNAHAEAALYELCERCNKACTHTIDLIRTAVSALKQEEMKQAYSNPNNK